MGLNNTDKKKSDRSERNILLYLEKRTKNYNNRTALGIKTALGWNEFTYKGVSLLSRKIACYLIRHIDVQKGDRIALLSESRPEFGAVVFASIMAGTTTVPLDIKLTKYELRNILSDSRPTAIIVSNSYLPVAKELQKEIDSLKYIISIDDVEEGSEVVSINSMPNDYEEKWRVRSPKSTALIIYTSGTTGNPKGVETTFANMLTQMKDLTELYPAIFGNKNDSRVLSILPMNHLFEMTVGFSVILSWGLSIYYTKSLKPKDITEVMRERKINFMIVVPAFLRLLKASVEQKVKTSGKFKQAMFNLKIALAKFIPFYTIKRFMFRNIHKDFGGEFFGCISGGAPLDVSVGEFFERIGIKIFQAYGLSETSPVISINTDRRHDIASVGRPLRSFEAKIDPNNGELIVRGPSVMKGYYNRPELTADVLEPSGWLHTGDVANIDKHGHIHITGRIKNMIVLSGGKKVLPEEVEAALGESENFQEICVFGSSRTSGAKEGTEEIVAVIVPTEHFMSLAENDEALTKMVREEAKVYANHLAAYKRPVNIIVQKSSLPKTATNKIKRREVKELVNA